MIKSGHTYDALPDDCGACSKNSKVVRVCSHSFSSRRQGKGESLEKWRKKTRQRCTAGCSFSERQMQVDAQACSFGTGFNTLSVAEPPELLAFEEMNSTRKVVFRQILDIRTYRIQDTSTRQNAEERRQNSGIQIVAIRRCRIFEKRKTNSSLQD